VRTRPPLPTRLRRRARPATRRWMDMHAYSLTHTPSRRPQVRAAAHQGGRLQPGRRGGLQRAAQRDLPGQRQRRRRLPQGAGAAAGSRAFHLAGARRGRRRGAPSTGARELQQACQPGCLPSSWHAAPPSRCPPGATAGQGLSSTAHAAAQRRWHSAHAQQPSPARPAALRRTSAP
jgi:hypothetical protein